MNHEPSDFELLLDEARRNAKRARGAQLGNTNTLKHGFYSRRFSPMERRDLANCSILDPLSEAVMIRILQRRLFEMSEQIQDFEKVRLLLNTVAKSTMAMDRLIRTNYFLSGSKDPVKDLISQACSETIDELKAEGPHLARSSIPEDSFGVRSAERMSGSVQGGSE
jgi:hypothetical protein